MGLGLAWVRARVSAACSTRSIALVSLYLPISPYISLYLLQHAEHRLGLLLVRVRGLAVGLRRVGVRAGLLRGRGGIKVSVGGRVRVGG